MNAPRYGDVLRWKDRWAAGYLVVMFVGIPGPPNSWSGIILFDPRTRPSSPENPYQVVGFGMSDWQRGFWEPVR